MLSGWDGKVAENISILLAEDDPVSLKLLEKILSKAGHRVTSVSNGRLAFERLQEEFFSVVLTDWVMPAMDGLELCRAIRKKVHKGYVFIILLTSRDSKRDIVAGLEAGADDYLTKPIDPAELLARLNTALRIIRLEQSLRLANEEIRKLSITDSLTGSYNRGFLMEQLPHEIKRARRYHHPTAMILCDLDHFKAVNDTYGHQAGDRVLAEFVRLIRNLLRDKIDWIARYGGEEFFIVLPETDLEGGIKVAQRICACLPEHKIRIDDQQIHITASFGVTGFDRRTPDSSVNARCIISQVDHYLYQAKQRGRNRVVAGPLEEKHKPFDRKGAQTDWAPIEGTHGV
jgi:diguanylate cyclase (GGDEF)-like protein